LRRVACGSFVVSRIEALGNDLTIAERVEHALVFRRGAEARVILREFIEAVRYVEGSVPAGDAACAKAWTDFKSAMAAKPLSR
jgi:hypothetical protein